MPRVTGPLFASTATGRMAGLGTFRAGRHGPELYQPGRSRTPPSPEQAALRAAFAQAHQEWLALAAPRPPWGAWWADWYSGSHPPQPGLSTLVLACHGLPKTGPIAMNLAAIVFLET